MLSWSLLLLSFHHIEGQSDSSDHYSRSEVDSMKTIVFTNPSDSDIDSDSDSDSTKLDRDQPATWYILGLSGNTSLVHNRLPDFKNYLRINLGSLTGTIFENVAVNSVSYVPSLLVNVSFSGNYSVSQLVKSSHRNDSILVLSSVTFYLTSFISSQDILIPRPVTNSLSTPGEEEVLIYLGVGAAIAFVLSAGVLVCMLIMIRKKDKVRDKKPLFGEMYSDNFSEEFKKEKELLTYTSLDDNFLPIETEDDFVPRYIKEEDCLSWLSDGSVFDTLPLESSTPAKKQNISTFSDDGSEHTQDMDQRSEMSKSPFYWTIDSPSPNPTNTPSPVPTITPSPLPPLHNSGVTPRKVPPKPPSRTDSLKPNSTSKSRPKSSIARTLLSSSLPGRPDSVPAPDHSPPRPGSRLSTPCPSGRRPGYDCSTALGVDQEEIDKDVHLILRNLEIDL